MQLTVTIDASTPLLNEITSIALAISNLQSNSQDKKSIQIPGAETGIAPEFLSAEIKVTTASNESPAETPFDATDVTNEELRAKAEKICRTGLGLKVHALLKQHGVGSISALPESSYASFLKGLLALDNANNHVAGDDIIY
jgi:hypothetical protein